MKKVEKAEALVLRSKGYSIREIHRILNVSLSSVSSWVKRVPLNSEAQLRISSLKKEGLRKTNLITREKTKIKESEALKIAEKVNISAKLNHASLAILCSMIYFCEGNKGLRDLVFFTNSDPSLISTFIKLLRSSFKLDESKFRACLHLHSYHNEEEQIKFWSTLTNIPKRQFIKTYNKKHTGKYKKEGYRGCIQIRYYDVRIARNLLAISRLFMQQYTS